MYDTGGEGGILDLAGEQSTSEEGYTSLRGEESLQAEGKEVREHRLEGKGDIFSVHGTLKRAEEAKAEQIFCFLCSHALFYMFYWKTI